MGLFKRGKHEAGRTTEQYIPKYRLAPRKVRIFYNSKTQLWGISYWVVIGKEIAAEQIVWTNSHNDALAFVKSLYV